MWLCSQSAALLLSVLVSGIICENFELTNGVQLVQLNEAASDGRSQKSVLQSIKNFLNNYEVQIKLGEIINHPESVERNLKGALDYLNEFEKDESGRKDGGLGGKKGGGAILAMATIMGGTMAALGFGAVGMLAMKALTVSAMALMLSAVIGLKKLLSKGDDEGGHSVSYIPVHHGGHRKRRTASELPYNAYIRPSSVNSF